MITVNGRGDTPKSLAEMLGAKRTIPNEYIINYGKFNDLGTTTKGGLPVKKVFNFTHPSDKLQFLIDCRSNSNLLSTGVMPVEVEFAGSNNNGAIRYGRNKHHTKGKDIVLIIPGFRRQAMMEPHEDIHFYTKAVDTRTEYRYHFVFNHLISTIKFFPEGEPNFLQKMIRNYDNGWRFAFCKPRDRFVRAALAIKQMTQMDFGAIDFALDIKDKGWVFEINSAPSLDEDRIALYVKWFKEEISFLENGGTHEQINFEETNTLPMSKLFDIYRKEEETA